MPGPVHDAGPDEGFLREALQAAHRQRRARTPLPLTHGFHTYAAGFGPELPARLIAHRIARRGNAGLRVLDPFCGGGTTLVEAYAARCRASGVDANPLACLLSRVRSTPLARRDRERLEGTLHRITEDILRRARKREPCRRLPDLGAARTWFPPQVIHELGHLRLAIAAVQDPTVRDLLLASLSAIIVKVSLQRRDTVRRATDRRIAPGLPTRFFAGKVEELCRGLDALVARAGRATPRPEVHEGDARELAGIPNGSVDLVVTSPPYAGTYDYAAHHALRYPWLDLDPARFERHEIGARRRLGRDEASAATWQREIGAALQAMARVLAPSGEACIVIGDGRIGDRHEPGDRAVRAEAPAAGLEVVTATRLRLPAAGPDPAHEEHLLVLRPTLWTDPTGRRSI